MRTIGLLLAGFATLSAVGCGGGSSEVASSESADSELPEVRTGLATAAQVQAFASLERETNRDWRWLQHATLKTPMHLSAPRGGAPTLRSDLGVESSTKSFLSRHKALFKLRDPATELRLTRSVTDELSMTHARFRQQTHGVPVVGAELSAHYDDKGVLTGIDATYVPDLEGLDVNPRFEGSVAVEIARRDAVAQLKDASAEAKLVPSDGQLVVFALGGRAPALAYEVTIRAVFGDDPAIWVSTIDAKTGEILDRYNNIQTVEGVGVSVLGEVKKIQVATVNGGFAMVDNSRGARIQTHDAGDQSITASDGAPILTSTSLVSWDTGVNGAGAAVDSHFNAGVVYDYYKKIHNRNGIDGAGGTMVSTAHYGLSFDGAFWDGTSMTYGDGGQYFTRPLSSGLDVVAHEFTHGVIQSTSNLRYEGQPGALNESIADIFGVFIEHSAKPSDTNNWRVGELVSTPALRDCKTPSLGRNGQPDHMTRFVQTQQDNGGVHVNSGIPNNAAFLMTMGGTNPTSKTGPQFGIGWEKSEKLWFRANAQYLQETSNFAAAAQATMQAAKDLNLTPNEQNIVECAWKAVGVVQGACATITDPQATTPAPGSPTSDPDTTGNGSSSGSLPEDPTSPADDVPAPRKRRVLAPTESSGCSVGTRGRQDLAPLAGVAVALALLGRGRRKRG